MKTFKSISEGFDYAREKGHPVIVLIDFFDKHFVKWKLFPSGHAKQLDLISKKQQEKA